VEAARERTRVEGLQEILDYLENVRKKLVEETEKKRVFKRSWKLVKTRMVALLDAGITGLRVGVQEDITTLLKMEMGLSGQPPELKARLAEEVRTAIRKEKQFKVADDKAMDSLHDEGLFPELDEDTTGDDPEKNPEDAPNADPEDAAEAS
jgi:hypothetical protein